MIEGNPLAELPSEPGSHIDEIKALKAGEWLNLGAPAPDEKWGVARGCAWGVEALDLAPELRGAFRTGEGIHAYVKPDGFGQDDYWFYDINAHRWICLYPGTDTKHFNEFVEEGKIKVDDKGRVVTEKGEPVPGHLLIHDWGYSSYDMHRQEFRFIGGFGFYKYYFPGWDEVKEGIMKLQKQGFKKKGAGPFAPWAYDANTGKFERESAINGPGDLGGYPQFLYMTNEKKFFYGGEKGVAYFDPATKTWERIKTEGSGPKKRGFVGCYDSRRSHVYIGTPMDENRLYRFDVEMRTWKNIDKADSFAFQLGTNRGAVTYDSMNDRIVIFPLRRVKDKKVHAYNPEKQSWHKPVPYDAEFTESLNRRRGLGSVMYDPQLGVHFFYLANDSRDDGEMWVYRLDKP